jgi:2-dehydropantoate 2-reductase
MKFVVLGAGAIGAYVGAALARGGADVTLIARGAHLAAMAERGVTVLVGGGGGSGGSRCCRLPPTSPPIRKPPTISAR